MNFSGTKQESLDLTSILSLHKCENNVTDDILMIN